MYELTSDDGNRRTYRSTHTNTEISTRVIFTDAEKNKWWAFENLLEIPFIRKQAAEKITQLYGAGINQYDLEEHIKMGKALAKSNEPDKYEKIYALFLNLEALKSQTADPLKQNLGLCSVYILSDNEQPDIWSSSIAAQKMDRWSLDTKAQGFFLNWLTDGINNFTAHYETLSKIVSIASQESKNTEEPITN